MKIKIITTGGTIDGLDYDKELDMQNPKSNYILRFLTTANVRFNYVLEHAFSKDSRFITSEDRQLLERTITSSSEDRILITHGTFTMAQTAEFLGKLKITKTIVLTGSFVLGSKQDTDAPFNLGYALHALQTLEEGVYIAINGTVFSWDNVLKNEAENRFERKS